MAGLVNGQNLQLKLRLYSLTGETLRAAASVRLNHTGVEADSSAVYTLIFQRGATALVEVRPAGYLPYRKHLTLWNDSSMALYLEPKVVDLQEVEVQTQKDNRFGISRLNNIEGTAIYAGKKSEAVHVQDLDANLATNNSRQIFSKVPGINVFENEGSGSSIGIGGRGLNPNRISNFNTRQNGYDISADALGYPESYYTPPTEAIERIDILRGASGLQYGTQFGGMINYRFVKASPKLLAGNFRQTLGSFGFFNSFNQLSGTGGRWNYNAFYQYKQYKGWRERSESTNHTAHVALGYKLSDKLSLQGEYTYMYYLAQQPGGLTDQQFKNNEVQVNRYRNWFKVNWNLYALKMDYRFSDRTSCNLNVFGLSAGRDALGYLGRPDRSDDTSANRNLLRDQYHNLGLEARVLHRYKLGANQHHLLVGARYYRGHTKREQGDADKTADPNFHFLNPDNLENSSYTFPSLNYALFAEQIFQLTNKWSLVPGIRYEYINTASDGYYRLINKNLAGNVLLDVKVYDQRSNSRQFVLLGLGNQYKLSQSLELYVNISQNYRSINFNDMRVANPSFQVDPQLKDESGFTVEGGFRGALKDLLYFDLGLFYMQYNNRIGTTLKVDTLSYQIMRYRTNIGNSSNSGVECMAELDWFRLFRKQSKHSLSTFVNGSYIRALYHSAEKAYDGNKVEYVPEYILRTGITYRCNRIGFTIQYSYTSEQFSDATNALSSSSGLYGLIPAYQVIDFSVHAKIRSFAIQAGINNAANTKYFTRRAEGYPGPGIIPSDPRNLYLSLVYKF